MDSHCSVHEDRSGPTGKPRCGPASDEHEAIEAPPPIGQSERRMQMRAYNHWAGLLGERTFPAIDNLDPAAPDFGPYSVLLDFSAGSDTPAVRYLGARLGIECEAGGSVRHRDDVPSGSLLSRIAGHYRQILANQAPVGFEAEFVNQRGQTLLYRGILLPFSSDDRTIDFVYGVINWKELADRSTSDELMLEMDHSLEAVPEHPSRREDPLTVWADGPAAGHDDEDQRRDGPPRRPRASARTIATRRAPREATLRRLRQLAPVSFGEVAAQGGEFALLVVRRLPSGRVVFLGEVPEDAGLVERAARKLLQQAR